MFSPSTYKNRRQHLLDEMSPESGLIVLLGNKSSAMNFRGNPYPFRQDSTFLYYIGIDEPGLVGILDLDRGTTTLYGTERSLDDVIWTGDRPSLDEQAERASISTVTSRDRLAKDLREARRTNRPIHILPPYRAQHCQDLQTALGVERGRVDEFVSSSLLRTVAAHRSTKSQQEVEQIETALSATAEMHEAVMKKADAGMKERDLLGFLTGTAQAKGAGFAYQPTCSIRGDILHNHEYHRTLKQGDLLLVDAGAASPLQYASDVTRVTPVQGYFTRRQRDVCEAVLDAQTTAIASIEPGIPYREIHLESCRVLTEHLIDLGLMSGPVEEAVAQGAHALFYPHGLGHMLGLDVHDMENLGEDVVGYADHQSRSDQFGLHTLRLARPLKPGFVLTVEPGCYFIPALINEWKETSRLSTYINYDTVDDFVGMGGIRIEDTVLVTESGSRILGPSPPKNPDQVESVAGTFASE